MGEEKSNNDFCSWLKRNLNRVYVFFALFSLVLIIESIGGTYIISTTQAIERQFQIPSKLSGFTVSASDFAYIPTVTFISYFGSKGNRAKWIGAGSLITAASHLIISSSNFVFPVDRQALNYTAFQNRLLPSSALLESNATFAQLLNYEPVKDHINETLRKDFLKKMASDHWKAGQTLPEVQEHPRRTENVSNDGGSYTLDRYQLSEIVQEMRAVVGDSPKSNAVVVKNLLQQYVRKQANESSHLLDNIRNSARAPFAFCSKLINDFREIIRDAKCNHGSFHEAPFTVLLLGLVGLGIGRTMPWSLGIPMIDDNVSKKNLPAFFAGINFVRILGPVFGFIIGSFCSSFYYTLKTPPGLTPKDPTWIGAWWMGYLFIGLLLIGPSAALYFFPAKSKSSKTSSVSTVTGDSDLPQRKDKKELSIFDKYQENDKELSFSDKFKTFRNAYVQILHSKVFVGILIGRVLDLMAFRGYLVFLPKYLENQFGIPQYNVHILMASFGVFGFALGTICGGLIMRYFKFSGRRAATYLFILSLVNTTLFLSKAFIGCYSTVNSVGLNGWATNYNYTQPCNANCGCQSAPLFPICDKSGHVFFSPCHAGCRDVKIIDVKKHELAFSSCECRPGEVLTKDNCQDNCQQKAVLFFCIVLLGAFAAGNCLVPGMLLLLRSVPPEHRSIALGLQGFMVSLLASLPSPLLWGSIVDTTCLVWSQKCPGSKGACAIYEPVLLRRRLHFTYIGFRLLSAIADLYVVKNARGLNIMGEEPGATGSSSNKNNIRMNGLPN